MSREYLTRDLASLMREAAQIRDAAYDDTLKPYSNDQFDDDVRRLIDFARHRAAYIREDVRRSPRYR